MLAGSMPAFEMFMTTWEMLAEKNACLKPFIEIGLSWARKYYQRMDNTKAYIIAMGENIPHLGNQADAVCKVLNPAVRMSWIRKHWDDDYVADAEQKIIEMVSTI